MRATNKEKKKLIVTKKDLHTDDETSPLYNFNRMTETPIYEYRIRKILYSEGLLSKKGFLYNDDILKIPGIAKKDRKGEILLHDKIANLLLRFNLSQDIYNSGNELLALLIDFDDPLYDRIFSRMIDPAPIEDLFSGEDIEKEVNKAYERVTMHLVDLELNNYLIGNEELAEIAFKE